MGSDLSRLHFADEERKTLLPEAYSSVEAIFLSTKEDTHALRHTPNSHTTIHRPVDVSTSTRLTQSGNLNLTKREYTL